MNLRFWLQVQSYCCFTKKMSHNNIAGDDFCGLRYATLKSWIGILGPEFKSLFLFHFQHSGRDWNVCWIGLNLNLILLSPISFLFLLLIQSPCCSLDSLSLSVWLLMCLSSLPSLLQSLYPEGLTHAVCETLRYSLLSWLPMEYIIPVEYFHIDLSDFCVVCNAYMLCAYCIVFPNSRFQAAQWLIYVLCFHMFTSLYWESWFCSMVLLSAFALY